MSMRFQFRIIAWTVLIWAAMACATRAADLASLVPPAAPLLPTVGTSSSSPTATMPAFARLKTVRVRPIGEALRVILVLDKPAAYAVRPDAARNCVQIDLLNAQAEYLPPELTQLNDNRLAGIWLVGQTAGLVTLELRFPVAGVKVEHFSLSDPAAVVVDLSRADQRVATLTARPHEFNAEPPKAAAGAPDASHVSANSQTSATRPSTEIAVQKGGSALPVDWIASLAKPAMNPNASTSTLASTTSESLGVATLNEPMPSDTATEVAGEQIRPINRDFDDFPVHKIEVNGPEPKEILLDFLNRHWASVITRGVAYLKDKRINQDTVYVLYMVAEARYQLGEKLSPEPLGDMVNFYQQAMRLEDGGELGAFGALRLAEMQLRLADFGGALTLARKAALSTDPPVRRRGMVALIRAQAAGPNPAQAVQTLMVARNDRGLTKDEQLKMALLEGQIRMDQRDAAGAWQAYERAFAIDPGWVSLDPASGETMARAALASGHPAEAQRHLEYINRTFSFRDDSQKVALALLYAQALEQLGDLHTAEQTYAVLLDEMGDTPKGREVQKLMRQLHPQDLLDSEINYARLLLRKGKLREAMKELHRSHQQGLKQGMDLRPFDELAELIVPPFMEAALAEQRPFEVIEAWRVYGGRIKTPAVRDRCRWPLAQALGAMELSDEAMKMIAQLKELRGSDDPQLLALEARMLLIQNQPREALTLLERLTANPAATALAPERADLYRELAQAQRALGQTLAAGQSLQTLARTPGLTPEELGATLAQAGDLFLQADLPVQAIELGLQGLVFEKEQSKLAPQDGWSAPTGQHLVLMLARAFSARKDHARAMLVLQELLARPWLTPEAAAEARWLLARAQCLQGQKKEANATLALVLADTKTPSMWREAARQASAQNTWDLNHPNWKIAK